MMVMIRNNKQALSTARRGNMSYRLLPSAFCLLLSAFCPFPSALRAQDTPADNWSQFRGNHLLTGVSLSDLPGELKLLWTYEAGESIESSAAIVGGTVFVGSQKGELLSLNLDNGAVYWKYHTDSPIGESSPAAEEWSISGTWAAGFMPSMRPMGKNSGPSKRVAKSSRHQWSSVTEF
jgi:hypothetical protein